MSNENNDNIGRAINARCEEIQGILRVMKRANSTGDDVRIEIESGLNLLVAIAGDLQDLASRKAA
ncbi:hypothetical protein [Vibrio furnissii]|uniref:hypothetical protein n=1 Tax=Vibrio furnissii TaxID=29494 RepID=UPI001EEB86AE|nr:hypothetical protein [Vibrio furnissii]MCG6216240.1 hypothetical protein [Vibrio furnissii]